jgi:excisionase family DNA binding protein
MSDSVERWMNITETALYLNMSVAFLRKCVRTKTVPFARVTKALRFRRSDLDRWLEAKGSPKS